MRILGQIAAVALTAFLTVALVPAQASAQGKASKGFKVLLYPLTTLGAEKGASKKIKRQVAAGIGRVAKVKLIGDAALKKILKRARPALRVCDGDPKCLAELGALAGADYVVYGELGGLGTAQVAYLKLIDVDRKRQVRSTTLELGGASATEAAYSSATQLIAPGDFVGRLALDIDVKGASIFVDGELVGKSPLAPAPLTVGSHALRVTHPEFRDFVRFIDIEFNKNTEVKASLHQFGVVDSEMERHGVKGGGAITYKPTPWYRQWYTIAGGGALVFITSAVVFGLVADGIDFDSEQQVEP